MTYYRIVQPILNEYNAMKIFNWYWNAAFSAIKIDCLEDLKKTVLQRFANSYT